MSRTKVLPPKLSIKQIQGYLDMNTSIPQAAHQQLCNHVNGNDFDLHLESCQFDTYDKRDTTAVNGAVQIIANSKPLKSISIHPLVNKVKYNGPSLFSNNQTKPYTVDEIRDQGIDYYITEPGSSSVGKSFDEDAFFTHRDHIVNYRKNDFYKDTLDKNKLGEQILNGPPSIPFGCDLPQSLDPESEYYAEELHLATQVHEAIFISNYGKKGHSKRDVVEDWFNNNKSDLNLSDASINRISAIISTVRIKRK